MFSIISLNLVFADIATLVPRRYSSLCKQTSANMMASNRSEKYFGPTQHSRFPVANPGNPTNPLLAVVWFLHVCEIESGSMKRQIQYLKVSACCCVGIAVESVVGAGVGPAVHRRSFIIIVVTVEVQWFDTPTVREPAGNSIQTTLFIIDWGGLFQKRSIIKRVQL